MQAMSIAFLSHALAVGCRSRFAFVSLSVPVVLARSLTTMTNPNPKVYFDITLDGVPTGRIVMEVCHEA